MANGSSFPRPYINSVPEEGSDPYMKYTTFPTTGIGARPSGLPKDIRNSNTIEHVGGTTPGSSWGGK